MLLSWLRTQQGQRKGIFRTSNIFMLNQLCFEKILQHTKPYGITNVFIIAFSGSNFICHIIPSWAMLLKSYKRERDMKITISSFTGETAKLMRQYYSYSNKRKCTTFTAITPPKHVRRHSSISSPNKSWLQIYVIVCAYIWRVGKEIHSEIFLTAKD